MRQVCACGKNGTDYAHGAIEHPDGKRMLRPFTCAEVLEIAARVEAAQTSRARRLFRRGR